MIVNGAEEIQQFFVFTAPIFVHFDKMRFLVFVQDSIPEIFGSLKKHRNNEIPSQSWKHRSL